MIVTTTVKAKAFGIIEFEKRDCPTRQERSEEVTWRSNDDDDDDGLDEKSNKPINK